MEIAIRRYEPRHPEPRGNCQERVHYGGATNCPQCGKKYVEMLLGERRSGRVKLTAAELREIFDKTREADDPEDKSHCYLCWGSISFSRRATAAVVAADTWQVEHILPFSEGGADNITNMLPAHASCNIRKGTAGVTKLVERQFRMHPAFLKLIEDKILEQNTNTLVLNHLLDWGNRTTATTGELPLHRVAQMAPTSCCKCVGECNSRYCKCLATPKGCAATCTSCSHKRG